MQSFIWTSYINKIVEAIQPAQMNIYLSNAYRKDLSWLHFDDGPNFSGETKSEGLNSPTWPFL